MSKSLSLKKKTEKDPAEVFGSKESKRAECSLSDSTRRGVSERSSHGSAHSRSSSSAHPSRKHSTDHNSTHDRITVSSSKNTTRDREDREARKRKKELRSHSQKAKKFKSSGDPHPSASGTKGAHTLKKSRQDDTEKSPSRRRNSGSREQKPSRSVTKGTPAVHGKVNPEKTTNPSSSEKQKRRSDSKTDETKMEKKKKGQSNCKRITAAGHDATRGIKPVVSLENQAYMARRAIRDVSKLPLFEHEIKGDSSKRERRSVSRRSHEVHNSNTDNKPPAEILDDYIRREKDDPTLVKNNLTKIKHAISAISDSRRHKPTTDSLPLTHELLDDGISNPEAKLFSRNLASVDWQSLFTSQNKTQSRRRAEPLKNNYEEKWSKVHSFLTSLPEVSKEEQDADCKFAPFPCHRDEKLIRDAMETFSRRGKLGVGRLGL